jgi:hypothetical protein
MKQLFFINFHPLLVSPRGKVTGKPLSDGEQREAEPRLGMEWEGRSAAQDFHQVMEFAVHLQGISDRVGDGGADE